MTGQPTPPATPSAQLAPSKYSSYEFHVYLKSDIQRGYHMGNHVTMMEADAATARTKIGTYYGTDLVVAIGPTERNTGVQLS